MGRPLTVLSGVTVKDAHCCAVVSVGSKLSPSKANLLPVNVSLAEENPTYIPSTVLFAISLPENVTFDEAYRDTPTLLSSIVLVSTVPCDVVELYSNATILESIVDDS